MSTEQSMPCPDSYDGETANYKWLAYEQYGNTAKDVPELYYGTIKYFKTSGSDEHHETRNNKYIVCYRNIKWKRNQETLMSTDRNAYKSNESTTIPNEYITQRGNVSKPSDVYYFVG